MSEVRTTCPYCGVGCGVIASTDPEGKVSVRGDPEHPANRGRLCSKGAALAETLVADGRLLYPQVGGERVSWERALAAVATRFEDTIAVHGADAVAMYVSGQLTTEAYYVANKFMKGFVGSANVDTNSRLCMASAVAGHKRAFGADAVPCSYEDLDSAELMVLVGSNAAWCHPVLFQRFAGRRQAGQGPRLVVIDPRSTDSARQADLHLPLQPGTDTVLFNGLLAWLEGTGAIDRRYLDEHTEGHAEALACARRSAPTPGAVAAQCALPVKQVETFYRMFSDTEQVLTLFSQGINQSSSGTDKVNAIINCHLATGRIGRPGMGPFSLTGQPNAMGGREVGGLANQLAAHMDLDDADARERLQRFWRAPLVAQREGLKAVELFKAVHEGHVRALWIMATNPVDSLPDADFVRAALERCDFVVVSDCIHPTDTSRYAHVLLPSCTWGERDGTVTNSDRTISRQRPFAAAPGEAREDWWMVAEVARRTGFAQQFEYQAAADIFAEHARLSGFENHGGRVFDISGLAAGGRRAYDELRPVQWPVRAGTGGTARLFADGRFCTASGKARLVAVAPRAPARSASADYPWILNTGRVRDHWHTMTRTGRAARLSTHDEQPFAELHPDDGARLGVREGDLVRVRSVHGSMVARARLTTGQLIGHVFVPVHWNDVYAADARVGALVNPAVDPISGQPELKHTPVRVEAVPVSWWGFVMTRRELALTQCEYWVKIREAPDLWRYVIAGTELRQDWTAVARSWFCQPQESADWVEYIDVSAGRYRAARLERGRLDSCVFVQPGAEPGGRGHLLSCFARGVLSAQDRFGLLAGRALEPDSGPRVCACMGVSRARILEVIAQGCANTQAVGAACGAGTQCGSCIPEIGQLLTQRSGPESPERSSGEESAAHRQH